MEQTDEEKSRSNSQQIHLANELEDVLKNFRRLPNEASWFKLDDANDVLLSGLIAIYAIISSFVEVGICTVPACKGIAGVNAGFLLIFLLLTIILHRFLRKFPRKQRIQTIEYLINRLKNLPESACTDVIGSRFRYKQNVEFSTAVKRNGKWRKIPNNLLVKDDIVALQAGRRAPANVARLSDEKVTQRDALLCRNSDSSSPRTRQTSNNSSSLDFLNLVDVEEYRVLESPLVSDMTLFLSESYRAQDTAIGKQIRDLSLQLRIIAAIGFLVFGIALGAARFVFRSDGYDVDQLILIRSATLICLLPCLSWPLCRFMFEWYSFWKMRQLLGDAGDDRLGIPLMPSTLVRTMGSLTALCGLDEDSVLLDASAVEEVFLLKGGKKTQVIDCCLDDTGKFGLRFEDPQWRNHFSSLKPLGLVCAIAGESSSGQQQDAVRKDDDHHIGEGDEGGESDEDGNSTNNQTKDKASLLQIYQQRVVPTHLSQLSSTMGFLPEDIQNFTIRARLTVMEPTSSIPSLPSSSNYPASHLHGKPIVECIVIEVPDTSLVAGVTAATAAAAVTINTSVSAPSIGRTISFPGDLISSVPLSHSKPPLSSGAGREFRSSIPNLSLAGSAVKSSSMQSSKAANPIAAASGGPTNELASISSRSDDLKSNFMLNRSQTPLGTTNTTNTNLGSSNNHAGTSSSSWSAPMKSHTIPMIKSTPPPVVGPSPTTANATTMTTQAPPNPASAPPPFSGPEKPPKRSSSSSSLRGRASSALGNKPPLIAPTPHRPTVGMGLGIETKKSSGGMSSGVGRDLSPYTNSALHMLCWGNSAMMLQFCSEYWDGESIWSLDTETKVQVQKMSLQWEKEDFDCVAFAYGPLSTPSFGDKQLFLSSKASTMANSRAMLESTSPIVIHPASTAAGTTTGRIHTPQMTPGQHPHMSVSSSPGSLQPMMMQQSSPSTAQYYDTEERKVQVLCANLARGLIFTGMTGSRDQPKHDVNSLVNHLHRCGIRFVYFSPREARCGRKIAEKMGLETDWNTSISLARPDELSQQQQQAHLQQQHHRHHNVTNEGSSSRFHDLYADWEQKARMPKGIEAIKRHIVEVDDVPLRVSVFTECVPGTIAEMVQVLRDRREVVAVFGNPLAGSNSRACIRADVSIAVMPQLSDEPQFEEMRLSSDFGRVACAFTFSESKSGMLLSLLGEGRITLYNYRQGNQCFIALGLVAFTSQLAVFCSASPDLFTLGHTLWLVWVIIPLLSCAPALRPRDRQSMLWERMPWKQSALHMEKSPTQRYVLYACVRLMPVAAFVAGMFFWTLIALDPAASRLLDWQSSPPSATHMGNLTYSPFDTHGSQSIALLAFVWAGCFISASFASRTETEKDYEMSFWATWFVTSFCAVGLQLAYNCVLSSVVVGSCKEGAFPAFPDNRVDIWIVLALCPPVLVPLVAFPVKRHDRKYYNRAMQMMRLDFETKLGQFSPK